MKRIILTGALVLGSLLSFNAMAQMSEEDAQNAVAQRQAVFKLLSFSNGPLGQMARGNMEFDLATAVEGSERVAMLAGLIPELFAADTSGMMGLETRAADTIWDNQADFAALAADLAEGANAAIEILNSQGAAGIRDAVAQI
ncbi:MAG: cytochrome c, partial [Pseudohongiellaceae bacterium]